MNSQYIKSYVYLGNMVNFNTNVNNKVLQRNIAVVNPSHPFCPVGSARFEMCPNISSRIMHIFDSVINDNNSDVPIYDPDQNDTIPIVRPYNIHQKKDVVPSVTITYIDET